MFIVFLWLLKEPLWLLPSIPILTNFCGFMDIQAVKIAFTDVKISILQL
jgi:hypothetical protein